MTVPSLNELVITEQLARLCIFNRQLLILVWLWLRTISVFNLHGGFLSQFYKETTVNLSIYSFWFLMEFIFRLSI